MCKCQQNLAVVVTVILPQQDFCGMLHSYWPAERDEVLSCLLSHFCLTLSPTQGCISSLQPHSCHSVFWNKVRYVPGRVIQLCRQLLRDLVPKIQLSSNSTKLGSVSPFSVSLSQSSHLYIVIVVQLLSCIQLFVTPWIEFIHRCLFSRTSALYIVLW